MFREPALLGLAFSIVVLFLALTFLDLPWLNAFTDSRLLEAGP